MAPCRRLNLWTITMAFLLHVRHSTAWSTVHRSFRRPVVRLLSTSMDQESKGLPNPTASDFPNGSSPSNTTTALPEPDGIENFTASLLAIDPAVIEIIRNETDTMEPAPKVSHDIRNLPFVNMFRGSANYIANHRNTVAVYHLPGKLIADVHYFRDLMNDVALTWLLGIQIVIVAGCRYQLEERIGDTQSQHKLRVTDAELLRIVKEEAGYVRFEVERQLARALRLQGAGGTKESYYDGNVVSGNFFSAQPMGVQDGTDYQYTGFVRRVEVEKIRQVHAQKDICMLSSLGVSPSGEVFNVNSESLAAITAGALQASKVVYFTENETHLQHKKHRNQIQNLPLPDARSLLKYYGLEFHRKGFVVEVDDYKYRPQPADWDMLLKVGWCTLAVETGVKRAHIISPQHGALLQELYTRDGSGTLISADLYEGIRQATVHDANSIYSLILPLVQAGTLIERTKNTLENDIETYYVYTRDNHIVACGQLKKFEDGFAEIGCLVVNKEFRTRGRGDAMLGYLERLCLRNGRPNVFVLSTQTMEWFVERGFDEAEVSQLPPSRQETYNQMRASKIYLKRIETERDLDANELWWNR